MTIKEQGVKSCGPQPSPEVPDAGWDLERLGDFARRVWSAIASNELSVTRNYWRLGLCSNLFENTSDA